MMVFLQTIASLGAIVMALVGVGAIMLWSAKNEQKMLGRV